MLTNIQQWPLVTLVSAILIFFFYRFFFTDLPDFIFFFKPKNYDSPQQNLKSHTFNLNMPDITKSEMKSMNFGLNVRNEMQILNIWNISSVKASINPICQKFGHILQLFPNCCIMYYLITLSLWVDKLVFYWLGLSF